MNKLVLIPIIIGSVTLIAGGTIFALGAVAASKHNVIDTNNYEITDSISKINANLETADFEIIPSTDLTTKIVCKELQDTKHTVSIADGELKITFEDNRPWYLRIFSFGFNRTKVTCYIPSGSMEKITVSSATGDVIIPNDFSFADASIKLTTGAIKTKCTVTNEALFETTTGDIVSENVNAKNANIKTTTGGIKLTNSTVAEDINAQATTGNVRLDNVKSKNLAIKTSTGSISLKDTVVEEKMRVEASTGSVYFDHSDAVTMIIKTSTGDVRGSLLTGKNFDAHTSTGKISLPHCIGGECLISTSTGDIVITLA